MCLYHFAGIEESVGATATLLVEDTGAKTKAPSLRELALQMVQDGRRWLTMTLMTCNALACHHDALKFLPTKLGSQMLPQPAMVPAQATVHSVLEGDFFTTEKLDELEDFYGEDFMHGSTNLAARRVRFLRFLGCSGAALAKPTEFTEGGSCLGVFSLLLVCSRQLTTLHHPV